MAWLQCNGSSIVKQSLLRGEQGASPYYSELTDVSTFTAFGIGNDPTIPVELMSFDVKKGKNNTASLTWATASEHNNAAFHIEHSTNGTDFQTIGQVKGNGTTNAVSTYTFDHTTPSVSVNYYRLKQVDTDGKTTVSPVRSVVLGKSGLIVKTTLVTDALDIVVSDEKNTPLSIFNISGQEVMNVQAQGAQRLTVSTLPAGLYIIRTATGDGVKFVKQ